MSILGTVSLVVTGTFYVISCYKTNIYVLDYKTSG
ncbi:hypothetical protein [Spiroplasma endosymbiont of Polydrusus formosus]